jgi:hypothetical protein
MCFTLVHLEVVGLAVETFEGVSEKYGITTYFVMNRLGGEAAWSGHQSHLNSTH